MVPDHASAIGIQVAYEKALLANVELLERQTAAAPA